MHLSRLHSSLCLFLLLSGAWSTAQAQKLAVADPARDSIMAEARGWAADLAHADMEGRGYVNEGHKRAADYIAARFEALGLEPIRPEEKGPDRYQQPFRMSLSIVQEAELALDGQTLRIGEDFIAASNSGSGRISDQKVVDLGYGLPEDFSKSFKGKVVLFRSGLPERIQQDEGLKKEYSKFAADHVKIDFAMKMNAAGIIILKDKLTAGLSMMPVEIPVVELLADRLPKKKVKKLDLLRVQAEFRAFDSQNVMGMVRGSAVTDSTIIVSAHYDHLGRQGDAIFYGGNDNASGTSMMMSMAGHYARPENRPRYNMLFIGFGAEEAGLLGSRHYVTRDPIVPLEQTAFILNLDLMANGDEGITAVAGTLFPAHLQQLEAVNDRILAVPKVKARGNAANSDHYFFVDNGVRGFFIYTLGGPPHYHDVHDTYDNMVFSRYYEVRRLMIGFLDALMEP